MTVKITIEASDTKTAKQMVIDLANEFTGKKPDLVAPGFIGKVPEESALEFDSDAILETPVAPESKPEPKPKRRRRKAKAKVKAAPVPAPVPEPEPEPDIDTVLARTAPAPVAELEPVPAADELDPNAVFSNLVTLSPKRARQLLTAHGLSRFGEAKGEVLHALTLDAQAVLDGRE